MLARFVAPIVAQRYYVSGVALGKVCRKLRVPLPGRGCWARKRAGQTLKRPALPPLKKGEQPFGVDVAFADP